MHKMFYQIHQYGQLRCSHYDIQHKTERELKEVCNRIVARAKRAVKDGDMLEGAFDVIICQEDGTEMNCFISDTSYKY